MRPAWQVADLTRGCARRRSQTVAERKIEINDRRRSEIVTQPGYKAAHASSHVTDLALCQQLGRDRGAKPTDHQHRHCGGFDPFRTSNYQVGDPGMHAIVGAVLADASAAGLCLGPVESYR
jgi:hypothetical protein